MSDKIVDEKEKLRADSDNIGCSGITNGQLYGKPVSSAQIIDPEEIHDDSSLSSQEQLKNIQESQESQKGIDFDNKEEPTLEELTEDDSVEDFDDLFPEEACGEAGCMICEEDNKASDEELRDENDYMSESEWDKHQEELKTKFEVTGTDVECEECDSKNSCSEYKDRKEAWQKRQEEKLENA